MNGLTRFLDWLDNAAGGMIRLAYLAAGITAIAVYFGAGHLPSAIEDPLNAALPWALAFAVETHTYITARRVRASWQEKSWGALKVNLGILAFLLAFSAWNQLGYLSETWHPPIGALALPGWLAYLVRALVIPAAFMAAAFLAEMAEPIGAQIETEARSVLADVFKIARKQRRRMLKEAERSGRDMTGALVELVSDPTTRRIISHAYSAIGAPVALPSATAASLMADTTPAPLETQFTQVEPPPAVGNEPSEIPENDPPKPRKNRGVRTPRSANANVVHMVRVRTQSAQEKARAAWQPGMSIKALETDAGISHGTAQKYHAQFTAESQPKEAAQ